MGTMRNRLPALLLVMSGALRAQPDAAPDAIQQQAILARVKLSAMRFRGQLPDFICPKLTTRWENEKQRDSLEELVYFTQGGRTAMKLLKLNAKATTRTHLNVGGFIEDSLLAGAIIPANIFGANAPAQFEWSRWEARDGRRMAVFTFRVAPWIKNYPDGRHPYLLGYHGVVFADAEDGMVRRLEVHDDPPPGYPFQDSGWDVDYGPITISGRELVLPVKAVMHLRINKTLFKRSSRNEIQFTDYRKFEADSTVTFENNN
jgi:hypothetical protein